MNLCESTQRQLETVELLFKIDVHDCIVFLLYESLSLSAGSVKVML